MILTAEQVKNFLPHREPFLFIDSVAELVAPKDFKFNGDYKSLIGCEAIANFRVTPEMPLLAGHFPGNPILPGVIQIEMMAQAASLLFILTDENVDNYKIDVALVAADRARFRHPIKPPMDLKIKAKLTRIRGKIVSYDCELFHNKELMSEVSVMAFVDLVKK